MFGLFRRSNPQAEASSGLVRAEGNNVFRMQLRTLRHGEIIRLRFTKSADIGRRDPDETDGKKDPGYLYRKEIVSPEHFDRGEVQVEFDRNYRVLSVKAEGAEVIPVRDWVD
jgi:hypothetical protein